MDLNDADMPFAAEMSWHGDLVFVAIQGKNLIHVMDAYTGAQVAGIRTGLAPQGLVLGAAPAPTPACSTSRTSCRDSCRSST